MDKLTKTEEQLIKHLWRLEKAYMKDLVEEFPKPKPAYTTIATILSRMVEKGYIGFKQRGKVREYFAKLKKADYFGKYFNQIVSNFFNDSTAQFASFFASKSDLTLEQLEELKGLIDQQIKDKKK